MSEFVFDVKPLSVSRCVVCNRFFFKGRLSNVSLNDIVKSHFKDFDVRSVVFSEDYDSFKKLPKKLFCVVSFVKNDNIFDFDFVFEGKNFLCVDCQKKVSNYFESFLQLRNIPSDSFDSIVKDVKELIVFFGGVVKEEKFFKNNVDFKLSSNKVLRKVLKELERRFVGFSKLSSKLHTKDRLSQKEKFRLTGLFYFFPFQKGDVLEFDGKVFFVKSVFKGKVLLFSFVDNSVFSFSFEKLKSAFKKSFFVSSIVKVHPEVFVLNEDFQPVKLFVPNFFKDVSFKVDLKVRVVNVNGKYFFVGLE